MAPAARKLSLIFPMAGEGARFGYRFKPFLEVQGRSFIEAALEPFRPWMAHIDRICFVFTQAQEEAHNVRHRLGEMFAGLPIQSAVLESSTRGPAETLQRALEITGITGAAIVCDCDHAVDINGLMRLALDRKDIACAVPTWSLEGEQLKSWSVAAIDGADRIVAIREKALPDCGDKFRGVIGCYYFADIAKAAQPVVESGLLYLSDLVARVIASGSPVQSVAIEHAHFFGDPERLARLMAAR